MNIFNWNTISVNTNITIKIIYSLVKPSQFIFPSVTLTSNTQIWTPVIQMR